MILYYVCWIAAGAAIATVLTVRDLKKGCDLTLGGLLIALLLCNMGPLLSLFFLPDLFDTVIVRSKNK